MFLHEHKCICPPESGERMKNQTNYNVGALVTLIISLGSAAVAYGSGFLIFDLINLPAWLFGPIGGYTLIFAFRNKNSFYYLGWSVVLLVIASASALYRIVNVVVMAGILLISIAVVSILAYRSSRGSPPNQATQERA